MEDSDILLGEEEEEESENENQSLTLQINSNERLSYQTLTEKVSCEKKGPQAVLSFPCREVLQYDFRDSENVTADLEEMSPIKSNTIEIVSVGLCIVRYDFAFEGGEMATKKGSEDFEAGKTKNNNTTKYNFSIGEEKYTAICFTIKDIY